MEFGLKIRKIRKKERNRIIDECLDTVDLAGFKNAWATELSGGETQRLALARALALSPRVLLCDEPTANVDAENQDAIMAILQRINAENQTSIIIATHNLSQMATLAQRSIRLEHGRLVSGERENVFSCSIEWREGECLCRLQERILIRLKAERKITSAKGRICIVPEQIRCLPLEKSPAAAFPGKVSMIRDEGKYIAVQVDIGIRLLARMKPEEYLDLRPLVGGGIALVLPPEAVSLL